MDTKNLKLIYIWDAYCGWCYGFSAGFGEFHKNHPELPITVLSGGLFSGEKKIPISNYPHIPGANQRIEQLSGVKFGTAYQKLLEKGEFVMDSEIAARGFEAMAYFAPEKAYELASEMQKTFYFHGKSLNEENTYREIAEKFGLNPEEVIIRFNSDLAVNDAFISFHKVQQLGVNSYPTLLLLKNDELIKIGSGAMTHQKLEEHLHKALEN